MSLLTEIVYTVFERITEPIDPILTALSNKAKLILMFLLQLACWFAVLVVCLWLSFGFYALIYSIVIPQVYQSDRVSFVKNPSGYEFRVFDSKRDFLVCKHDLLLATEKLPEDDSLSRACLNPMQSNNVDFQFNSEMYEIHLKVLFPLLPQNFEVFDFPVRAEFINKHLHVFYADSVGYFDQMKYRGYSIRTLYSWVKSVFGMGEENVLIEVPLTRNFDNRLFEIDVMNVYINDPKMVIREASLELRARLYGIRHYMAHWFWTTAVFTITSLAFMSFTSIFAITFAVRYLTLKENSLVLSTLKENAKV